MFYRRSAKFYFIGAMVWMVLSLADLGWTTHLLMTDISRIDSSYDRVSDIEEVLTAALDIETGARGYIITGRPEYLEPYVTGRNTIEATMQKMDVHFNITGGSSPGSGNVGGDITSGNTGSGNPDPATENDDFAMLAKLIAKKLAILQPIIDQRHAMVEAGISPNLPYTRDDTGKRTMDQIRHETADIITCELRNINRLYRSLTPIIISEILNIIGLFGCVALLSYIYRVKKNQLTEPNPVIVSVYNPKQTSDHALDPFLDPDPNTSYAATAVHRPVRQPAD